MKAISTIVFISLLLISCSGESDKNSSELMGEGVQIEGAWARPASEGRISATYFLITNFEDVSDTLLSVTSDVAQLVEVHESYQQEGDMMGMREVSNLELPAQSTIRFEQGRLHIMLIQLTRTLGDGDSFVLTFNFANSGEQTIEVPVRL